MYSLGNKWREKDNMNVLSVTQKKLHLGNFFYFSASDKADIGGR